MTVRLDRAAVEAALCDVPDPEIPMVSVVDLGIVQAIAIAPGPDGDAVTIAITPTFAGCPALEMMRDDIRAAVRALGAASVEVNIVLDPPWTSDRITPAAREAMRAIGLAPPPPAGRFRADPTLALSPTTVDAAASAEPVPCPFCGSTDTVTDNPFGSTLCRSVHYCRGCEQPFEAFKAL